MKNRFLCAHARLPFDSLAVRLHLEDKRFLSFSQIGKQVNELSGKVRIMINGNLYVEASDFPRICKAARMFFKGYILRLFYVILVPLVFWFVTIHAPGAETFFVPVKNH